MKPPATVGHPDFERAFRVHANQCEQTPFFMTGMWLFAVFCHGPAAGVLGLVWCGLRLGYGLHYSKQFEGCTRYTIPSYLVVQFMLLGTAVQIIRSFVADFS